MNDRIRTLFSDFKELVNKCNENNIDEVNNTLDLVAESIKEFLNEKEK